MEEEEQDQEQEQEAAKPKSNGTSKKPLSQYSPEYQSLIRAGPRIEPLRQAHGRIVVAGSYRSRALLTKLLTLACAAGTIGYVHRLLISVQNPDQFLFNSLLKASSSSGFAAETVLFYRRMVRHRISPTSYTFTSVIKSCADISSLELGERVHAHAMVSGFGSDRFVQAGLVTLYSRSGQLGVARKVFDEMPERTAVAWNSMISSYEQNGRPREAIAAFHRMRKAGFDPDSATFASLLSASSQLGALRLGRWVHDRLVESRVKVNAVLGSSLINMYGRCGDPQAARLVFNSMSEPNVVAWTAMISALGAHGRGREAVALFRRMRSPNGGPPPNGVTLVAVLSACAHSGLVDEGRAAYAMMTRGDLGWAPGPEHHVCMVDMLGRAGLVDEAHEFIRSLDSPGPAVWTALLGACKLHGEAGLGAEVAERVMGTEPENPGHYVAISNIHAMAGRTERVEAVREKMGRRGLRKEVGYSAVEVGRGTHVFRTGDRTRPEVYRFLDELVGRSKEAGYVPVRGEALHDVEEEERELALRYHSEKLAVAFGVMRTGAGVVVRVMKNLRMCEDCHLGIKYFSLVEDREIVVRDRLRFHHFKHGRCSCSDYW